MKRSYWHVHACLAFVGAAATLTRSADAAPPDPALIARISRHVAVLDQIGKHASLHREEVVRELEDDGSVHTESRSVHVETDGKGEHETLEKCVKDGKDVTQQELDKAREKKDDNGKTSVTIDFPFTGSADDPYVYDQIAADAADPTRVEISFTPKSPSKRTVQGKVLVDTTTGTLISATAKLSKPPMFVDWVHFTAEFGARTLLGPALSRLTFDAKGGFLFIHRHYRGDVVSTDYRVAP